MGADLYLHPPDPPPKEHMVVDRVTHDVYGPFYQGRARTIRRKMLEQDPNLSLSVKKIKESPVR